jgi:hypothetical protein
MATADAAINMNAITDLDREIPPESVIEATMSFPLPKSEPSEDLYIHQPVANYDDKIVNDDNKIPAAFPTSFKDDRQSIALPTTSCPYVYEGATTPAMENLQLASLASKIHICREE